MCDKQGSRKEADPQIANVWSPEICATSLKAVLQHTEVDTCAANEEYRN